MQMECRRLNRTARPRWVESLGAGAWGQLASDFWRGGVSSIVGASWVCEYRFGLAP